MKQPTWLIMLLIILSLATTPLHATPSDAEVAQWTGDVLLKTLTVNYKQLENHTKLGTVGMYYSGQAKTGIKTFFASMIPIIIEHKMDTTPIANGPPKITQKGMFNGVPYWQVTQSYNFPRIKKNVWFSVMVIENQTPMLLIENLNIRMDGVR